jgi:pilus assembly protein FimV
MKRSVKLSVLVGLALASSQALALDLGQIQVKSALGQPLVADIPFHADHPGQAGHLKVTMASADAFARAGIDRADLKVPLSFKVITHADGKRFIRVTSAQPVREPYLDFLIKVSWPKGKVLREYTVLLDPLSRATAMAPQAASTSAPAATQPPRQAQPKSSPAATPAPAAPRETRASDTYGPVQHGDTLSSIALANPIAGVSYQQMLLALKTANPNAFYENNVNALKSGAVLRIPTREQARAVTPAAAIATVRQQNRSWQQIAAKPTVVAGSGGGSAPIAAGGDPEGGDHLTLVPPQAKSSSSAGASAAGDAPAGELRQQLARSEEALSSQKQSTADLNSRVAKLEKLQKQNQRLLSLKNAEIAELQGKLADARKAAGLPAPSRSSARADLAANAASIAGRSVAASASAGFIMPGAAASTGDEALAAATPADNASVAAVAPAAAGPTAGQPSPANDPPAQEPALADDPQTAQTTPATVPSSAPAAPWYQQLWARIALAVIIALLIIWAILRRRKPARAPTHSSLADRFDDTPYAEREATTAPADAQAAQEPASASDDPDGEHELLVRLGQNPDDVGLHLELVSLYYARRDVDRFEAAAEAMHAYVDDETQPEWQDVLAMGRELAPDYPLFVPADAAHDREMTQDDSGLPEDVSALPPEAISETEPEHGDEAVHEDNEGFVFAGEPEFEEHRGSAAADSEETVDPQTSGLPDESEFDALPPLPQDAEETGGPHADEDFADEDEAPSTDREELSVQDVSWNDDDAAASGPEAFSDDPVDTKLDLARAYIDMGDPEGARAMLDEAVNEGSQMQKDTAQKLLDDLA